MFVNYRTGDGDFAATLITRILSARFGAEHVFLASRSIRPGEDFAETILKHLAQCDVLLAVVGPRWHAEPPGRGQGAAATADDWVYRELVEAFRHGLRVIPVFLDHRGSLSEAELPAEIAALARCQFLRLSHRNDTRDLARLVDELTNLVPSLVLARAFSTAAVASRGLKPSAWLRPEYEILPFAGRDDERADLLTWVKTPAAVSARLVTGPAGQGKTRLALRLCHELGGEGWVTGMVHETATGADLASTSKLDSPLLAVVDGAEHRGEQVHALAAALLERPATAPPARLLLLGRDAGEWLHRLRTRAEDRVAGLFRTLEEYPLAPLVGTEAERHREFRRAVAGYARYLDLPPGDHTPPDLAHPRYGSARVLHAAALLALLEEHTGHTGAGDRHPEAVPAPDAELHRAARPECPYRGLRPFQEQDARFFHGRERQVQQLVELTGDHPMIMVIGASGSGKSSLVRAGLLPSLRRQNVAITVFRPSPGIAPADLLAHALTPIVGGQRAAPRTPGEVALLADAVVESVGHLVLFVDQFEELVAAEPQAARELLHLVAGLVRAAPTLPAGTPALRAVLTGRSADLDEVLTSELAPLLRTVSVPRMGTEDLRTAITGPPELPLVSFEPGLVDRIIADAADAPGQLPLVEFALTRLWEDQQGAMLTHRAYDQQGGVAGALAAYAQEVYERKLLPRERPLAERLLVQLARPGEDGGFTLTPARLDRLDPDSRALAGTLAAHHLVVLRDDPGQPEVVALTHEALVQQWRQLREWLVAAQDFRSWQEQLRTTLEQWRRSGRDHATLLRGAPLAAAEDWLETQPGQLTGEEREYITTSRRHERRGQRQRRLITALIGVLAVATTVLAGIAVNRNQELSDQLRRAAAISLAQEAQQRAATNPRTALQLAQAAWRHDPGRPEAYGALLQQYLTHAGVEEVRTGLWSGAVAEVAVTGDGGTTVIAEEGGRITAWTDLFGGEPRSWFLATVPNLRGIVLSPDGRRLAVTNDRGGVTVWDLEQHTGPLPLRPSDVDGIDATTRIRSAGFSADGTILVLTLGRDESAPGQVEVWDVSAREPRTEGFPTPPGVTSTDVRLIDAAEGNAWFLEHRGDRTRHAVLRDLTTGEVSREAPADAITPDGLLVRCVSGPAGGTLSVHEPGSAAARHTEPVPNCPDPDSAGLTDLGGRYAVLGGAPGADAFRRLNLIDLHTGQNYLPRPPPRTGRARPDSLNGRASADIVAVPDESGVPTMFVFGTGALFRVQAAGPADDLARFGPVTRPEAAALGPDGRIMAMLTERDPGLPGGHYGLLTVDLGTQRIAAYSRTSGADLDLGANPRLAFGPEGRHVFAIGDTGTLYVLSATDLTVLRTFPLQPPPGGRPETAADQRTSIVPLSADEVAVLRGNDLARWEISTGEDLGMAPSPLASTLAVAGEMTARRWPLDPGRMLTTSTQGVHLWNMMDERLVRAFQPLPGNPPPVLLPDRRQPRVAVHYREAGRLEIWNPDANGAAFQPLPVPGDRTPVAFTHTDKLITASGEGELRVWDLATGGQVASVHLPGEPANWSRHGDTLTAVTANGPLSVRLDPEHWMEHLCRINDRDYTAEERASLPAGADPGRPCAR
ncbi:TIR domain-containing protein [Amycolatopsis cihanbeyliensis]|uniref:nSTAND1 domain-containing NTPase n=1 Tax=Amycolatopsis cihanbeyliensis TaxID=1128664 RepID=UPI001FE27875|nr:TIR domain-containing protein [Amycolatopsis cihanbeyliensis]